MNRSLAGLICLMLILLVCGCASSAGVDKGEPKRVLGRENDVHVDAQIQTDRLGPSSTVEVKYEIENRRSTPIAIAELNADTRFDPETQTIVVTIGSEVPGNEFLPRLVRIQSGERKLFTTDARLNVFLRSASPLTRYPRFLRLQVHFLGEVKPFEGLIGIPERAIKSAKMADELFPLWIEHNEMVVTNSIPIDWTVTPPPADASAPARRRP